MKLTFYNHSTRRAYESLHSKGHYEHTSGGSADSLWLNGLNLQSPFDLLYTLDLGDPVVDLHIPGVTQVATTVWNAIRGQPLGSSIPRSLESQS